MSAWERRDPGTTGGPFNGTWSGPNELELEPLEPDEPDEAEPDGLVAGSTL
jgi:hypothetical protein